LAASRISILEPYLNIVPSWLRDGVIVRDSCIIKEDYASTKVVISVKDVFISIPDVEDNRRSIRLDIVIIIVKFQGFKEDGVDIVLNDLSLNLLIVLVPQRDVGIGGSITVGCRDVFTLEDEASYLPRLESLGRRLLPDGVSSLEVHCSILSFMVNCEFKGDHASFILLCDLSFCQVSHQRQPSILFGIRVRELCSLAFPEADRLISIHKVHIHSVKFFYGFIGCRECLRFNPLAPSAVILFHFFRSLALYHEVINCYPDGVLLLPWQANSCSNLSYELEVVIFIGTLLQCHCLKLLF
jgi:hypothetical protein